MKRGVLVLLGALVIVLPSCSEGPTGPTIQGLDRSVLEAGVARILAGDYGAVQSLLVYRSDELVLEEYFDGTGPGTRMSVESVTKSVSSMLVGRALEEGDLPDGIDTPLLEIFPQYETVENPGPLKSAIRIEDVLTMTSGLAWDEWTLEYTHPLNSWVQMMAAPDWTKYVLDRRMLYEPGTRFVYSTGGSLLLSSVVERAVGMTVAEYAEETLFDALGIADWRWPSSPEGHSLTGDDLELTPPDMALIGRLALNGGRWNGEQVVPTDWIELSTAAHVGYDEGVQQLEYGYQWWRFRDDLTIGSVLGINDAYFAWGNGGQFIIVVPHLEMVVVMTGANYSTGDVDSSTQLFLFRDYILPAVVDS